MTACAVVGGVWGVGYAGAGLWTRTFCDKRSARDLPIIKNFNKNTLTKQKLAIAREMNTETERERETKRRRE